MVAKVCARSQGQPLPGVLSAAMMAMRSVMVLWLLGIPSGPHVLGARLTPPAGDRSSQGAALAWNGARAASPAPDRGRPRLTAVKHHWAIDEERACGPTQIFGDPAPAPEGARGA